MDAVRDSAPSSGVDCRRAWRVPATVGPAVLAQAAAAGRLVQTSGWVDLPLKAAILHINGALLRQKNRRSARSGVIMPVWYGIIVCHAAACTSYSGILVSNAEQAAYLHMAALCDE